MRTVKLPNPPNNLWEKMDELRKEFGFVAPPETSFSSANYKKTYDLTEEQARKQLAKYVRAGKLSLWGKYKGMFYYEWN